MWSFELGYSKRLKANIDRVIEQQNLFTKCLEDTRIYTWMKECELQDLQCHFASYTKALNGFNREFTIQRSIVQEQVCVVKEHKKL